MNIWSVYLLALAGTVLIFASMGIISRAMLW